MAFRFLGNFGGSINGIGGMPQFPYFLGFNDDDNGNHGYGGNDKLTHDTYNVFVNNDYVGNKVLVAQGEKVEDINGYLKTQGFRNFDSKLKGNSYSISCNADDSKHMKDALNVYLHIR